LVDEAPAPEPGSTMTIAPRPIALIATVLALSSEQLAAQSGRAGEAAERASVVSGRIVDHETGAIVPGATVTLAVRVPGVRPIIRSSDDAGAFEFQVPAGGYTLRVESLGYLPFDETLDVAADSDVRLEIRVSASPLDLDPIVVVTARRPAFMAGFEERRSRGRNHTAFFTAAEIADKNPDVLTDLFAMVPGAHVEPGLMTGNYGGNSLRVAGTPTGSALRGCSPDVWVNGVLNTGVPVDEMFPPDQVEAVELYTLQHNVPSRFEGPRRCGALVIWLRGRPVDQPFRPSWQRWLLALGALGATIMLTR
jgi:hypothetical protein